MSFDKRIWLFLLALLLLGLALTLPGLGDSGLWDPWEPKYAQTAREMAQRGDWIVPYYRETPRLNRPPMTYWLIGMSQSIFGVNEAASRLPSALLAVLCPLALALAFARRGRPWEGLLCGAVLLTSPQWLLLGRFATLQMPLASCLGLLLAVAIAAPSVTGPRGRRLLFALAVLLLAGAALTSWPRAVVLPAWGVLGWAAASLRLPALLALGAVAALYHAGQLSHSPGLIVVSLLLAVVLALIALATEAGLSARVLVGGTALVTLLVLPWFAALYWQGLEELKIFNYKYALNLGESAGKHTGPYAYVLRIVAVGALPWSAAALAGLVEAFGRERDHLARLLAGVLIGTLAFFTLSEAKMGHFYVVIQPALAGLCAIGTIGLVRRRDWTAALVAAALLVVGLVVWDSPSSILETATAKKNLFGADLATPALTALVLWSVFLLAAWLRRRPAWAAASLLPAILFSGGLALRIVPGLESVKSAKPMWTRYLERRQAAEPIGSYGSSIASSFYYSNNEIVRLYTTAELKDFLAGPDVKFLILPKRSLNRLASVGGAGAWEQLDRSHPSHTLVRYAPQPGRS